MKLKQEDLESLFAWVVEVQEYIPLTDGAKRVVDNLIDLQKQLQELARSHAQNVRLELTADLTGRVQ